ncbi:MAG: hypothetical protein GOVbin4580_14 [Prokaryotic dsDNA virus sp.]|jgi:hypothetical protein|nr:MAG: hypothetical protein GOVbin4580_14 [Prokaryotic dsDNA virus sp.]|tara:strand:+ start:4593 stop:5618 length:1026 start_codon:yes stop_codon:yes gene_type:complete
MALDGQALSPQEFKLAFKPETTIGTANTSTMRLINVDSVETPALNITQVLDVRTGSGRTAKTTDMFTDEKGTVKEISFSGIADTTVLPVLLQAITTTAVGSSPASYDIAGAYTPPEIQFGVGSISDNLHTFTVAVSHPEAGNDHSMIFKGCVLTSLSISGSMATQSGRIAMSGTFQTRSLGTYNSARPTSTGAFGTTFYNMSTFGESSNQTNGVKVVGIDDCVMSDFSLNIENPSEFVGFDSDGNPQAIARGIPEISVTFDATIKADDNTSGLHASLVAGATNLSTELTNHATFSSATTFGIKIANSVLTSVELSPSTAMFYAISSKAVTDGSADLVQIIA